MAAKEMYDYLSTISADVDVTLSTPNPQRILTEAGSKQQVVHFGDDGSEMVITLSDSWIFLVTLLWESLTSSDAGTILDIYYNASYANRRAKSFKWAHPSDGHTYVVKFAGDLERSIKPAGLHGVSTVSLKVLGRIADA